MSRLFAYVASASLICVSGCSLMRPASPPTMVEEVDQSPAAKYDSAMEQHRSDNSKACSLTFDDAGFFGFLFWMFAGSPD